jgi:integrase/recombinase XerD
MRLSKAIQQYGAMKQMIGISFEDGMRVLHRFCEQIGDGPVRFIAKPDVLAFLDRSVLSNVTWLLRYRLLKAFFEYWMARGELAECPMPIPRQPGVVRATIPHIYSANELRGLLCYAALKRTPRQSNEFGPQTFRALLLFLYGTGARMNETLALQFADVDLKHSAVTFHHRIAGRKRTIPIGKHLCASLRRYSDSVDRAGGCKHFFVGRAGKAIRSIALTLAFQTIRRKAGMTQQFDTRRQPCLQDFRRTFAVHCMRSWLREGKDLRSMLPVLGAYLGHVSPVSTEAYLSVTPERLSRQLQQLGSASV